MKMELHNFQPGETVNVLDYNPFKRTFFLFARGEIIALLQREDFYVVEFKGRQGAFREERYVDPCAQGTMEPLEQYIAKLNY